MRKTTKSNWVIVFVFSILAFLFLVNDLLARELEQASKLVSKEEVVLHHSSKHKVLIDFQNDEYK